MKTLFIALFALHSLNTFAQTDANDPANDLEKTPTVIEMNGEFFCDQFGVEHQALCSANKGTTNVVNMNLDPVKTPAQRKWTLRLYFGNGIHFYDPTTARIQTSRLDLTVTNLQAEARTGYRYFRVWERPFVECMRWIDEPTNNLKIVFDKNNHQAYLLINHPKLVYINGHGNPGLNNDGSNHVTGTVDGYYHDANMPLNPQFDGYNTQPGELNITNWENSWMFMQGEVGYGYAIPLLQTRKAGSIVFTPQIGGGIYTGYNNSAYMKKGGYWDNDDYSNDKMKVMGYSITPSARLEWRAPRDRFGIFAEARRSYGNMRYDFLDGKVEHQFNYSSITFGFSTVISNNTFKWMKPKGLR